MAATPSSADVEEARSAHEELAQSLLRCMGRESAIHVCRMNGWAGVLDVLLAAVGPAPEDPSRGA